MISTLLKFLLITALAALLSACSSDKDDDNNPEQPQAAGPYWSINDISLKCGSGGICPDNQGMLIVVHRSTEYHGYYVTRKLGVARCTGTIYDTYRVITAGHCLDTLSGASEIYFKTVDLPGKPGRLFHVKSTPIEQQWSQSDFWSADYGAAELVEPATGITFAHPALQLPSSLSEMVALVVNSSDSVSGFGTNFVLDAVKCNHGFNTKDPVTYEQNPSKYMLTDCKVVGGNSGGSVVHASDPLAILGIVSASNNVKPKMDDLSALLRLIRADNPKDKQDFAIITNARCFNMPGWSQAAATCIPMSQARLDQAVKSETFKSTAASMKGVISLWFDSSKAVARAGKIEIHFMPEVTPLKYIELTRGDLNFHEGFGLIPVPMCVRSADFPKGEIVRLKLQAAAYKTLEGDGTRELDTTYTVNLTLRAAGNGKYWAVYSDLSADNRHVIASWSPKDPSEYKRLKSDGGEISLSECTGTEKQAFLGTLDRELAKNP